MSALLLLLVSLPCALDLPGEWVPLFNGQSLGDFEATDFAGAGRVEIMDGKILLDTGQPLTGITYHGSFPRDNYELEVVASRESGNDFFCGLTFPVGEDSCSLILGGWGGALVGLSCLDGVDASENETTLFRGFERGRLYRIRTFVGGGRVRAWVDGDSIVDVQIAGRSLSVRSELVPSLPLGIASFATKSLITSVRLRSQEVQADVPLPEALRGLGLQEDPQTGRQNDRWSPPTSVVLPRVDEPWRSRFQKAAPAVSLRFVDNTREAEDASGDSDAVIGYCSAKMIEEGKRLRWVQVGSAGVERYLALPGFAESDVVLTNGQRIKGPEIAEHVMALVLALYRGLSVAVRNMDEGEWNRGGLSRSGLKTVAGRTLLVVGLGGIGTEVARRANALGMRVIATRRSKKAGLPFIERVGLSGETTEMAMEADVVVNCLPLTDETADYFDSEFFDAMKEDALFINVGRGGTVDTEALVAALTTGEIGGAGLDVTDPEPLPVGHPLWEFENVIITPHVAARSEGVENRRLWLYVENLRRFAVGEPLLSVVDKERGY